MRKFGFLLLIVVLTGCKQDRTVPTSPTLADQRKPKPPVELNTRGTPGRIHVEEERPVADYIPAPLPAMLPKEVVLTAQMHTDVVFDDGTETGEVLFEGTAVQLDAQPYIDVSASLYSGAYEVVEPELENCYFYGNQQLDIDMAADTITWNWSNYDGYGEDCKEWGEKALSGGVRIEISNHPVATGSIDKVIIELVP